MNDVASPSFILGSSSPRRLDLMRQIGIEPSAIVSPDIDESVRVDELPACYVERLALEKGQSIVDGLAVESPSVVLTADTTVSSDGQIFGKPADFADFRATMEMICGAYHSVHSGVCVYHWVPGKEWVYSCFSVETRVLMIDYDASLIEAYWKTGEPHDKAGGYGVQGMGGVLVQRIEGSYTNVVGLPVCEVASALRALGLSGF